MSRLPRLASPTTANCTAAHCAALLLKQGWRFRSLLTCSSPKISSRMDDLSKNSFEGLTVYSEKSNTQMYLFSQTTREILINAGWNDSRRVDVEPYRKNFEVIGQPYSEFVLDFLRSFGGIEVTFPSPYVSGHK